MKKIEVISQMTYDNDRNNIYKYKFCSVMSGKLYHPTCNGDIHYNRNEFNSFILEYCNGFKLEFIYD